MAADPTEIATALQNFRTASAVASATGRAAAEAEKRLDMAVKQNLWTPAVSTIDGAALYRARADVDPQTGSGPSIRPDTTPADETGTKTATVTEPATATGQVVDLLDLPSGPSIRPAVVHGTRRPDVVHPNPQDTAIVPDVTVLPEPDVVHPNPQDTAIVPDVTVLPEPDVVHLNPQDTAIVPDVTVLPEPDVVHPNPQDTAIVPDVTVLPEPDAPTTTVAATVKKIGTAAATETRTASDTLVEPPVTPNEAPQQEPQELRAPNATALRAPDAGSLRAPKTSTETFARVKPQVTPRAADFPADLPQAAPRPPGSYPRRIEHNERVEYRYHPETGEFDARLVESSDPVVTRWDMTSPDRDERQVGTWDVMPTDDGVVVTNGQRVSVPEGIKDQLVREAERTEEPVSKTATLRYQHDLDTRETEYRMNTPSAAEMAETLRERSRQRGDGKLDPRYQMLADAMKAQAQEKRGQSRRRRAGNRTRENQPTYSLPQIVITQEPISRRRIGGL